MTDAGGTSRMHPATMLPTSLTNQPPPAQPLASNERFGFGQGSGKKRMSSDFTNCDHKPTLGPNPTSAGPDKLRTLCLTNQKTGRKTTIHFPEGVLATTHDVELQAHAVYHSSQAQRHSSGWRPDTRKTDDDNGGVKTLSFRNEHNTRITLEVPRSANDAKDCMTIKPLPHQPVKLYTNTGKGCEMMCEGRSVSVRYSATSNNALIITPEASSGGRGPPRAKELPYGFAPYKKDYGYRASTRTTSAS